MGACDSCPCCKKDPPTTPQSFESTPISNLPKECICQIKSKSGIVGIGFFCRIPYPKYDKLKDVLITSNQIFNYDDFILGNQIQLDLKNCKQSILLNIDNNRKCYSNDKYKISIIEIRKDDNINNVSFLETDIYNTQNDIFIIHYYNKQIEQYYAGQIINFMNYEFIYYDSGTNMYQSIGCPILNVVNKVIGMNITLNNGSYIYSGIFIKNALENYYTEFSNNYINIIFYDSDYNKEYNVKILGASMFGELILGFYMVSGLDFSDSFRFIFNNIDIPCYSCNSLLTLNIINNSKIYIQRKYNYNNDILNIMFHNCTGGKILILAHKNMKSKELIMKLSQKFGISYRDIIKIYLFLFNSEKVVPGEETLENLNLKNMCLIEMIKNMNIIGKSFFFG